MIRQTFVTVLIFFMCLSLEAKSESIINERFDKIELKDGRILYKVKIKDVLPSGVFLFHSEGVETIQSSLFPDKIKSRISDPPAKAVEKPQNRLDFDKPIISKEYDEFDDQLTFQGRLGSLEIDKKGNKSIPLQVAAWAWVKRDPDGSVSNSIMVAISFLNAGGEVDFRNAKVKALANGTRVIPIQTEADTNFQHSAILETVTAFFHPFDFGKIATSDDLAFKVGHYDYATTDEFRFLLHNFAQTVFSEDTKRWQREKASLLD